MSVQKLPVLTVDVELTVLVTRNGRGDLHDGIEHLIRRVDGVESVDAVDVHGLQPGLNDLAVDLVATIRLDPIESNDESAVEAQLLDGFGVRKAKIRSLSHDHP